MTRNGVRWRTTQRPPALRHISHLFYGPAGAVEHAVSEYLSAIDSHSPSEHGLALVDSGGSSCESVHLGLSDDVCGKVEDDDQCMDVASDSSNEGQSSADRGGLTPGRPQGLDLGA